MIWLSTDFYDGEMHYYFKCDCPDNPAITLENPTNSIPVISDVTCMRCGKVWRIQEVPRLIALPEED